MKSNYKTGKMGRLLTISKVLLFIILIPAAKLKAANYYSFLNGDWSDASIWTTDPTGLTSVGSAVPGASDAVFIINNRTNLSCHVIDVCRIKVNSRVLVYLWQTGCVTADDWAPVCHCLKSWQPKAL